MLKSDFTTEATNKIAQAIEVEAAQTIANSSWLAPSDKAMEPREEAGNVKFNPDGTFDADLFHLVVNYISKFVIDTLWSKALIKNFLALQLDMWEFGHGVLSILRPSIEKYTPSGRCKATSSR